MWECQWLNMRTSPDIKHFIDSKFPNCNPKWEMTQQQVLKNIVDENLFGIVECDISIPDHLRTYFAEMQPIFKNANISRDDIGEFMYSYAIKHDILKQPRRSLIGSYYGGKNSTSNSTFKMVPETRTGRLSRLPNYRVRSQSVFRIFCRHRLGCTPRR